MRIAFIPQPFETMNPPVRGGSLSMWIYYMGRICARRGHEVTVFGNHGGRRQTRSLRHDDVSYVFTPTLADSLVNHVGRLQSKVARKLGASAGIDRSAGASWHHWGYAREAARRVHDLQSDVVHIMNYSQ